MNRTNPPQWACGEDPTGSLCSEEKGEQYALERTGLLEKTM